MHRCLCCGCGDCPEQVGVIICLQKTLPLRGALPVRVQRFPQTDNDLQQMNSPCNFIGYGDFSYMGVSGICSDVAVSRLRKTGDILFADGRIFTGISGCELLENLLVLLVSVTG